MSFKFRSADLESISSLRLVTTVTSTEGKSSDKLTLLLFDVDHEGNRNLIKLVNGNKVGLSVSGVMHLTDLNLLQRHDSNLESKQMYVLEHRDDITDVAYQLFVGDMAATKPSMTTVHSKVEDVLSTFAKAIKANPTYPHAYYLKYVPDHEPEYRALF